MIFGSCRVGYPHEPPYDLTKDESPLGREVDALRAYALRMRDLAALESYSGRRFVLLYCRHG